MTNQDCSLRSRPARTASTAATRRSTSSRSRGTARPVDLDRAAGRQQHRGVDPGLTRDGDAVRRDAIRCQEFGQVAARGAAIGSTAAVAAPAAWRSRETLTFAAGLHRHGSRPVHVGVPERGLGNGIRQVEAGVERQGDDHRGAAGDDACQPGGDGSDLVVQGGGTCGDRRVSRRRRGPAHGAGEGDIEDGPDIDLRHTGGDGRKAAACRQRRPKTHAGQGEGNARPGRDQRQVNQAITLHHRDANSRRRQRVRRRPSPRRTRRPQWGRVGHPARAPSCRPSCLARPRRVPGRAPVRGSVGDILGIVQMGGIEHHAAQAGRRALVEQGDIFDMVEVRETCTPTARATSGTPAAMGRAARRGTSRRSR